MKPDPEAFLSEFGFQSFFSSGGDIVVQFFQNDGNLIDSVIVSGAGSFGFSRDGGIKDIAGISVHTFDPGGLAYDNFVFGTPIPVPHTIFLLVNGLIGLLGIRRKCAVKC